MLYTRRGGRGGGGFVSSSATIVISIYSRTDRKRDSFDHSLEKKERSVLYIQRFTRLSPHYHPRNTKQTTKPTVQCEHVVGKNRDHRYMMALPLRYVAVGNNRAITQPPASVLTSQPTSSMASSTVNGPVRLLEALTSLTLPSGTTRTLYTHKKTRKKKTRVASLLKPGDGGGGTHDSLCHSLWRQ